MARRRGRDYERIDACVDKHLGGFGRADAELRCYATGPCRVCVGDRDGRNILQCEERLRMKRTDPAYPDEAQGESRCHRNVTVRF